MSPSGKSLRNLITQLDNRLTGTHRGCLFLIILAGFLLRWYSLSEGHAYAFFAIRDETIALKYAIAFLAGDPNTWYIAQPALNQGNLPALA